MKTSELTGAALDWAVAKCEGYADKNDFAWYYDRRDTLNFSTDWAKAGPIIERNEISLDRVTSALWVATRLEGSSVCECDGPTQLTAAMRCYVKSQYGDDIDLPEELKGKSK
jgi:hypothetical protein